jgi:hypothetical protein
LRIKNLPFVRATSTVRWRDAGTPALRAPAAQIDSEGEPLA